MFQLIVVIEHNIVYCFNSMSEQNAKQFFAYF